VDYDTWGKLDRAIVWRGFAFECLSWNGFAYLCILWEWGSRTRNFYGLLRCATYNIDPLSRIRKPGRQTFQGLLCIAFPTCWACMEPRLLAELRSRLSHTNRLVRCPEKNRTIAPLTLNYVWYCQSTSSKLWRQLHISECLGSCPERANTVSPKY
jgi:hypothetical protein